MEKLIQELETWRAQSPYRGVGGKWWDKFDEILSLAKSRLNATERVAEPLAVLADRKGVYITEIIRTQKGEWQIEFFLLGEIVNAYPRVEAKTYAEAESKARTYLEALPDSPKSGDKGGL